MADSWEALMDQCANCRECALAQTRTHVVFGVGNPEAEIMLVGEGPGANEDQQGVPFVGKAGQLLDAAVRQIRMEGLRAKATCSYAAKWFKEHPDQSDLL